MLVLEVPKRVPGFSANNSSVLYVDAENPFG